MRTESSMAPYRRPGRVLGSLVAATLACLAATLAVAVAPAAAVVFSNASAITIPDPNCVNPDIASPYPSTITVSGLSGTITDVNVTLTGVTHPFEGDLELLLVGPSGGSQNIVLLSDAGTGSLSSATVTFDDAGGGQAPQNSAWGPGTYKPTNYLELSGADAFPAPAPSPSASTTLASAFNGAAANGTWRLYVIDDACPDAGAISGGWSLDVTTASLTATSTVVTSSLNPSSTGNNVTFTATVTSSGSPVTTGTVTFTEGATTLAANVAVNGSGQASFSKSNFAEGNHIVTATYNGTGTFATSSGTVNQRVDTPTTVTGNTFCNPGPIAVNALPAAIGTPYPSNIFITGASTTLSKVVATLKNVTHSFPDDIDVLLVGPGGQNLVLVSDAGTVTTNVTVNFDDAAAGQLAQAAAWGAPGSTVSSKPVDYDPAAQVDAFPAPAPSPSAATTLATFTAANPNGTWRLYVVSDGAPDTGNIAGGWCLTLTTPPDTSINTGPSGLTSDATPTFTFSSPTAGVTFECKVDVGGTFTTCGSPHTTATLSDGAHTFFVRAVDAGNPDPTPASRAFTVDATPPNTTINTSPSNPTNDATADFTFSSSQAGSTFQCNLDNAGFTSCTSPLTTATLTDGSHTFAVRATDPAGNTDPTPASVTFTVDTDEPDTTIGAKPSDPTSDPTADFTFTSDEDGSTFACKVDAAGSYAPCTTPHATAALTDGTHTFFVRATDPGGNTDSSPASYTFVVDTGPPQTTIDTGPPSPTNDRTADFTFSSSEPGSSFECKLDAAGTFASCTSPHATAPLTDGPHTFFVRATDPSGNTDQTPAARDFTVDATAPDTTIDGGPAGLTGDATPTFTFSSSQTGSTFECRIDAGAFAACTNPLTTAVLPDGEHTVSVRATDPAGNTDGTPATRTFTVDASPPDTAITSGPSGPTTARQPTFTFASSEAASTFECSVDSAALAPCTSPATTAALADGGHTFSVRATDAAGNVDPSPATSAFVVTPSQPPVRCEGKIATIVGGPGPVVTGTARNDVIVAAAGGQRIDGRGGNDTICAGPGADVVLGGSGNDVIRGGAGNDRLLGQAGNDRLLGDAGNDDLRGQAGRDVTGGGAGNDRVDGGAGNDLLDERRLGGAGADRLLGGAGNDRVRSADSTRDNVDCGLGVDDASLDTLDRQRRCERIVRVRRLTPTSGFLGYPLQRLAGRPSPVL